MSKILGAIVPASCAAGTTTTNVGDDDELQTPPLRTVLYQNVPNPFNPTTTIRFDLAHDAHVALKIYDVAGRLVRTLVDGKMKAGRKTFVWDGLENSKRQVASGMYLYRLVTRGFTGTRKLVVMR